MQSSALSGSSWTSASAEVPSTRIGDEAQLELRALDPVAWLRFSSVYLGFRTIEEFRDALDDIDPAHSG